MAVQAPALPMLLSITDWVLVHAAAQTSGGSCRRAVHLPLVGFDQALPFTFA
jgi:hypothetical protein